MPLFFFFLVPWCIREPKSPEFIWAQKKNSVSITVNVPNVRKTDAVIEIKDDGRVYFKGFVGNTGREQAYMLDITLLKPINAAESTGKITGRNVSFKIKKTESGPYWVRLLKSEKKNIHCKIDWNNWVDEDEDQENFFTADSNEQDHQHMDFASGGSSSDDEPSAAELSEKPTDIPTL